MTPIDLNSPAFWQQAASLAARAHRHQVRKDGDTPYVAHPFRVAMTVRHVFGCDDPVALAAALLHDTIEDTTVDYDDIAERFGEEVADVVAILTKDKRMGEAERESAFYAQIAAGPWQARLVKLADGYDNLCDAPAAKSLPKALEKAMHAVDAAGDDERVAGARRIVGDLIAAKRGADD